VPQIQRDFPIDIVRNTIYLLSYLTKGHSNWLWS